MILIADDLVPSGCGPPRPGKVVGFAIETGGRTSHTTIIARSLRLPAVTGLDEVTDYVTNAVRSSSTARRGRVILHPTPEVLPSTSAGAGSIGSASLVVERRDWPATPPTAWRST